MRDARAQGLKDVILFVLILTVHIWIVLPLRLDGLIADYGLPACAVGLATFSLYRHGFNFRGIGVRWDNLGSTIGLYIGVGIAFASLVVLAFSHTADPSRFRFEFGGALGLYGWALLQEFLLLAFLLQRISQELHSRFWAAGLAALLFAYFHWPNPFLTIYTLIGGWVLGLLYQRYPNLFAAAAGHAVASSLASQMLPDSVTGWMKVGPGYLYRLFFGG